MTIKKLPIILLLFSLVTQAYSGSMYSTSGYYDKEGWPFVATLSLGPAWSRPGEAQFLTIQPNVTNAFIPIPTSRTIKLVSTSKGTSTVFTGELFLGLYGQVNSVVVGQLGLAIAAYTQVKLQGNVFVDSNIAFNNFTYSYNVRNEHLALKGKLLYDPNYYDVFFYLSGSAGIGKNHASAFTINTRLFQEIPPPAFSDKSQTAFTFTLGTGLETYIDDNWRVGLGYEFADWGRNSLGPSVGQTLGGGPTVKSLRTHELQISISFIA